MNPRSLKLLSDAEDAVRLILEWTANREREAFFSDTILRAAVEREATIFGDALVRLRREDPAIVARALNFRDAMGLRNALVHGYDSSDAAEFWSTIVNDLPGFAPALGALRAELDQD